MKTTELKSYKVVETRFGGLDMVKTTFESWSLTDAKISFANWAYSWLDELDTGEAERLCFEIRANNHLGSFFTYDCYRYDLVEVGE